MIDSFNTSIGNGRERKVLEDLNRQNESICTADRQIKFCKMSTAPLVFYRGTNHLFWSDFAKNEQLSDFGNKATKTWIQGDLHPYNFGSFDNSKGELVYEMNDYDEAMIADYQYDLWRMAIGIVLIARQNDDLSISQQKKVIDTFSITYLDTLKRCCKKENTTKQYTTIDHTTGILSDFLGNVATAYSRKGMLDRWAPKDDGERTFKRREDNKLSDISSEERHMIMEAMTSYRQTIDEELAEKDSYFEIKDIARRLLAGTGSLGTNRYYVLITGGKRKQLDRYRILDIKRQSRPSAYIYLDAQAQHAYDDGFKNNAHRHAKAYRKLTRRTDKHLGWVYLDTGDPTFAKGHYSVRERSPFKEAFPGEALATRATFSAMAEQWAEIIAINHARANQALAETVCQLTADRQGAFCALVRDIAFSYADQVIIDWQIFTAALQLAKGECKEFAITPHSYRDLLPR